MEWSDKPLGHYSSDLSKVVRIVATKGTRFSRLTDDGKPKGPYVPPKPRTKAQERRTDRLQAEYDKLADRMREIAYTDRWVHDHYNERDPYDD